ncbi:class I SAM-dependent DNA methyltransferase [uncultured Methylibium sp.]|uniref:class I SAM-dependent DNA methyltransferase n=1 Tax=uncultured Methylibium sp. TaxID=381093 RepID=UPI0025E82827|nr:class I SAM-dependent DNA methyltransferase [uncultured Methylibium sp.]
MKPEEQQFLNDLDKRLWNAADRLRSNVNPSDYMHVVLGLVFLKYVSDAFKERRTELQAAFADPAHDYYLGPDAGEMVEQELEARDYYLEKNIFWVPALARWDFLRVNAKVANGTKLLVKNGKTFEYDFKGIGRLLDDALEAVEKDNPKLKNVLDKSYARWRVDDALPGLIDEFSKVPFHHGSLRAKDILGHIYEYFLGEFSIAAGKRGGEFYTPKSIVTLIVQMLEPFQGRVYDPCCGSGGFFVQSERFVEEHGGKVGQLSVYGQEANPTTWRLASMNMAIRGMDFDFGKEPASTYTRPQHPDLRADFIMANPPFNMKAWKDGVKDDDVRWKYGVPPEGNANFAWMQHMIHHLAPHGSMALLLANGSMSSNTNNEGEIRKAIVEADLVECMVALPGQLFTNTQIPACIWFLTRSKAARNGWQERKGQTLFIDARNLGYMRDRVLRDFKPEDVAKVADTFHRWKRGEAVDEPGFAKAATLEDIRKHDHVLTPGRYVGAAVQEDDGEPFEQKMARLTATLSNQLAESARLEAAIRKNLAGLGYPLKEPG